MLAISILKSLYTLTYTPFVPSTSVTPIPQKTDNFFLIDRQVHPHPLHFSSVQTQKKKQLHSLRYYKSKYILLKTVVSNLKKNLKS